MKAAMLQCALLVQVLAWYACFCFGFSLSKRHPAKPFRTSMGLHMSSSSSSWWRLYNVYVKLDADVGKDHHTLHPALLKSIACNQDLSMSETQKSAFLNDVTQLAPPGSIDEDSCRVRIVRKAFDGRWKKLGQPQFVYTVDVRLSAALERSLALKAINGRIDLLENGPPLDVGFRASESESEEKNDLTQGKAKDKDKHDTKIAAAGNRVVVIGAGPAGLFAAIELVRAGLCPIIIERGQPVERRGRDIGALFNRKLLDPHSNLCYGEGGAGTWSDGKLTTRIGKNSEDVRAVLATLVEHGAPDRILVDGKPHLGTDRLVTILRDLRASLTAAGVEFRFGHSVERFETRGGRVVGVVVKETPSMPKSKKEREAAALIDKEGTERGPEPKTEIVACDDVVFAVGHSARALYENLVDLGVEVEAKPIAVGFRIEHPQDVINHIQYGPEFGLLPASGKGPVPVADYRLAVEVPIAEKNRGGGVYSASSRACYSFCMCPGGQIVPTSVKEDELCINGMSFSQRQSKWANSALVVNVTPEDMVPLGGDGPLRGVAWQQHHERLAAAMGGGNLTCPVQRATDYMTGTLSEPDADTGKFSSSYRLGVRSAPLHDVYPAFVTEAVRKALLQFERRMPGFLCPEALLHGVETRTSAPVQVKRDRETLECVSLTGLHPAGEGAGYAGGIVSAAVDGMKVGRILGARLLLKGAASDSLAPAPREHGFESENGRVNLDVSTIAVLTCGGAEAATTSEGR